MTLQSCKLNKIVELYWIPEPLIPCQDNSRVEDYSGSKKERSQTEGVRKGCDHLILCSVDSSLVWLVDGHAGNGAIGLNILTVIHSRFLSRLSLQLRQGIYAYKLKEKFYSNIHG